MANYQNIRLDKTMYKAGVPFSDQLEKLDPSAAYAGTDLAGLDAFQRQLKRFDIRVSGPKSDTIAKFFGTSDSAALFPEYVARAVLQGMDESAVSRASSRPKRSSTRSTTAPSPPPTGTTYPLRSSRGRGHPETVIKLKDNLVRLTKRGRMLVASYEAVKFQRSTSSRSP